MFSQMFSSYKIILFTFIEESERLRGSKHISRVSKPKIPLNFFSVDDEPYEESVCNSEHPSISLVDKMKIRINTIRMRLKPLLKSEWWFWLVILLVFLNTGLRCSVWVENKIYKKLNV